MTQVREIGSGRIAAARYTPICAPLMTRCTRYPSSSVSRVFLRWTTCLLAIVITVAALAADVLQLARAEDRVATNIVVSCPLGWVLYSPPLTAAVGDGTLAVHTCVRVFTTSASASAAESACTSLFSNSKDAPLSADGVTPWPYAHKASPHGAAVRSAEENTFLQHLLKDATEAHVGDKAVVVLGGVAGYGVLQWYADAGMEAAPVARLSAPTVTYTNFAADVDWQLHSGLIAMRASGEWTMLAPATSTELFACAFNAEFAALPPDDSSSRSEDGMEHITSSSSAGGSESNSCTPKPGSRRAQRPAVPQPAPPCMTGWSALPPSVDTSNGAADTVCYRLLSDASEAGGLLGEPFDSANAYCTAAHPKGSLASVMSEEENAWIVSALLGTMAVPPTACTCDSSQRSRAVLLGGSFMRDGSGAGLMGSWYVDRYLFNASAYALSKPSSPAWPTSANLYYSNWGTGEPMLHYGVVGILPPPPKECNCSSDALKSSPSSASATGTWVSLDPRSTQPFLCSYLNDGSAFPTPSPTPTQDPSPTSSPTPSPSEECLSGWSYLSSTESCYRVYPITSAESETRVPVTVSTMETVCGRVLRGHVAITKASSVHAVATQGASESQHVGYLLSLYLKERRDADAMPTRSGSGDTPTPPLPVSLVGVSFIDGGAGGFYINGARELDPMLAYRLWAESEPVNAKGCVAVDVDGLWHYVPCSSSSTSPSMPENEAVQVIAYTCQYSAAAIDPEHDLIPPTTTTTPTSEPGGSSESGNGSAWPPLGQRVAALSGAVHVVVAAGSTGIYTLQGPKATTPPAASVEGLHFFFAPLSDYYTYPTPQHAVDGTPIAPPAHTTPRTTVEDLLPGPLTGSDAPFAPCEGYKDQSRIARVRSNTITVHHTNHSEVGHVCISQDGHIYLPTAITYEVTEVTVDGFIHPPQRSPAANSIATWLPPLFCEVAIDDTTDSSATTSSACVMQRDIAIDEHATGTVQLALRQSGGASGVSRILAALSPEVDTVVSHVRLSSSADCMGAQGLFLLLDSEIAIRYLSRARYTHPLSPQPTTVERDGGNASLQYSVFSYQDAGVYAAHLPSLDPIYNTSEVPDVLAHSQPPAEYFVCVAVEKPPVTHAINASDTATASRRLLALWGNTVDSDGVAGNATASTLLSIAKRLAARGSVSPTGAAIRTYTAVPGLKAHLVPPPVSAKGLWALPPRWLRHYPTRSADGLRPPSSSAAGSHRVTLVPAPPTHKRRAHYHLRTHYPFDPANPMSPPSPSAASPSTAHLHIPQYSSPTILLDGHDVERGMMALLSQDPNGCNRWQPLPRDGPAEASSWPLHLDTMVPLSTVTMTVEGSGNETTTATMAYMQLNLNHTGLWGHHPTRTDDPGAMQQTWYVCIAHSPLSPFLPLSRPALRITVHRQRVDSFFVGVRTPFTVSDAAALEAEARATDASTTHLNLNTGFAGVLWLRGFDVRLWSTATLQSAEVFFAVMLPSSGTPDETAVQCSNTNLFYASRGLGLLTADVGRGACAAGGESRASDVNVEMAQTGMIIPPAFMKWPSPRRMQLCLSVPPAFSTGVTSGSNEPVPQDRLFIPIVNTTLDVRPIELLYMGHYSAAAAAAATPPNPAGATLIRLAEGSRDVVLPLTGYGIRPDTTMFLSSELCHGVPVGSTHASANLVEQQSVLNISLISPYDLPSSYWARKVTNDGHDHCGLEAERACQPGVFAVLKHSDLLSKSAAQRLFGGSTATAGEARTPLNVCLYAPGTATLVFLTNFKLVVEPPRVMAIRNLPSDASLLARATAHMPPYNGGPSSSPPSVATVVYASTMDLLVEGFGLDDENTWLIPALDCNNVSSYLWRTHVPLSAVPSHTTTTARMETDQGNAGSTLYAESTRYVDPQTSLSSWFIALRPAETARIGADSRVHSGTYVDRFQWCVRFSKSDGDSDNEAVTPYASTGLSYRLVIPAVDGFATEDDRNLHSQVTTVLTLPTQHAVYGRWFPMQLIGPIVDVAQAMGTPLYMFLTPEGLPCRAVKNSFLKQSLLVFGNASFSAVNGSAVLLPRWLTTADTYKLCASALYPTLASADEGIEAALEFFTMHELRVVLIEAMYSISALNHTTSVTVKHGQEWTLPISGSFLTHRTLVRFHTSALRCSEPMVATSDSGGAVLPDIRVLDEFPTLSPVSSDKEDGEHGLITKAYVITLSQSFIRSLAAPATLVLCFQPQEHLHWRVAPLISLDVEPHVRHPTAYAYFPADGSEDVVQVGTLAPSKVALDWNTGEENTINIVGAAGRPVSLALWCLSASGNRSSSSRAAEGGERELVPCRNHRRVMFVKPLDNDENPCFVDAEAVPDSVMRGPYVVDNGLLALPYELSRPAGGDGERGTPSIIPDLTEPWIMCLETGPERWREPVYPMLQLQYTHAVPTGFRVRADDPSNTTAPFPAYKADVKATTSAEVDHVAGMPIGGNTTLILYAQDSSQAVYLNGYGIERNHRLRFGARCEERMSPPASSSSQNENKDVDRSEIQNVSSSDVDVYLEHIATVQSLANTRLYTDPLIIEDDSGLFLVPSTHIVASEEATSGAGGVAACISTDGGTTYFKTSLALRVLPSRLRTDTETKQRNFLERILLTTLMVPQNSRGSVDLTELIKARPVTGTSTAPMSSPPATATASSSGVRSFGRKNADSPLSPGTQVLFSEDCSYNSHGIPPLTITSSNVLTLTNLQTGNITMQRLHMCLRDAEAAATAVSVFVASGMYYHVMPVRVRQVSLHGWTPTDAMQADSIEHVVLRRSAMEDLLLPVLLNSTASVRGTAEPLASSPEDEFLRRLQLSPFAMSMLSLTRFYVGRPCYRSPESPEPADATSPYVSSYAGMQLTFGANNITVSSLPPSELDQLSSAEGLEGTLMAVLPSYSDPDAPPFTLNSRGSVCFSVDGGRHYLSVGIVHFTEDWAPTLRVTLDTEDDEIGEGVQQDSKTATVSVPPLRTTNAMRVYAQTSTTRQLIDTRFVDPSSLSLFSTAAREYSEAHVQADLGQLTASMLWNGFFGNNGFATDGLLHLPASWTAASFAEAGPSGSAPADGTQQALPLTFFFDNRQPNISTNVTVTVVPWSLQCYGDTQQQELEVRQQDVGLLAPTAPGRCSAGVQDGVRMRLVPLSVAECSDTAAVDTLYLFDISTLQPAAWGAMEAVGEDVSSVVRAMQLPMGLRYAPEGLYALCIRHDLPYTSSNVDGGSPHGSFTATYTATPLRLRISRNWTINSVSGGIFSSKNNTVVAISQSGNAELPVTGTAVGVRRMPLLLAFAPWYPLTVTRRGAIRDATASSSSVRDTKDTGKDLWTWSNGCAAVPEAWDPVTGMPLVSVSPSRASSGDGLLLTAPWYNAHEGVLRVGAAYVSRVERNSSLVAPAASTAVKRTAANTRHHDLLRPYALCYSVDGGLSFQAVGRTPSRALAVVVVPPVITSLSCNRTTAVAPTPRQLEWSAEDATATSMRVQYLYTSTEADSGIVTSPQVVTHSRADQTGRIDYSTRPPTYIYASTSTFLGHGIGATSGRLLPASTETSTNVPSVAAAVALLRTSRYGARCDGVAALPENFTHSYNTTASGANAWSDSSATASSPLAMPIVLINMQHGGMWSSADTAAVEAWRKAQTAERVAQFEQMNPVLSQHAWVNQTAELWTRYKNVSMAPINGQSILGFATDAATAGSRSMGESIVVCLSLDGKYFYSADIARAAAITPGVQTQDNPVVETTGASVSSTAPVTQLSSGALYLRAIVAPNISTVGVNASMQSASAPFLWMREASMVMQLLARPIETNTNTTTTAAAALLVPGSDSSSPYLGCTSASLIRFQEALAAALGVDPSVVIAQLHLSGFVTPPQNPAPQSRQRSVSAVGSLQRAEVAIMENTTAPPLQTYALVVSISADSFVDDVTNASAPSAAPDLLYRTVQLLRKNVSGPALLETLVRGPGGIATASLSSLTINFTLRNGVDLHTANATMSSALPSSPAQEALWRRLFLSIPHATLIPDPVPDADDNDTRPRVQWWAIILLLLVPVAMGFGTYYVYKKYLKRDEEPTETPVVVNGN